MDVVQCTVIVIAILFMSLIQRCLWIRQTMPATLILPGAVKVILEAYMAFALWVFWGVGWLSAAFMIAMVLEGVFLLLIAVGVFVSD